MKMWIARTLGGAVCTLSLVALGTGGAYASPHPSDGGIDLDVGGLVKVKVGDHSSSSDKGSSPSSSSGGSSSKGGLRIKVRTPGKVLPRVQVKAGVGSSSRGPSAKAGVRVGRPTPSSSSSTAIARSAAKKAAEKKAAEKRAAAREAAQQKKKAEARRAAAKRVADRRAAEVGAVASLRALSKVVPPTVVRADAEVLSLPVRACVEVNAAGCSRYVYSGTPAPQPGSENGGGGYATVLPVARVVPAVVAKAAADVPVVGEAKACVLVNAPGCTTGPASGSGSGTGTGSGTGSGSALAAVVPPVLVRADASVLSVPVRACVEVNVTGCERYVYSGAPATNPGSENGGGGYATVLPSVVAVADAALPVVGQVDACVLVNAAGCEQGTGAGTTPGGGIVPPVVGTVGGELPGAGTVGACVLVNTPGCTTDGAGNPGGDPSTNPGGDPTTPGAGDGNGNGADPGDSTPGDDAGNGKGNGNGNGNGSPSTAPVQADLGGLQGPGGDRSLARTGAAAGTVGAVGAGLALLAAGAVVLRRRAGARRG